MGEGVTESTVTLIGGEMEEWSDLTGPRPVASGTVYAELAARTAHGAGRVLVAGPHDWAIVDRVVAAADRTVLLQRSVPDAEEAVARYAGRPVEVLCGDLEGLAGAEPFDAIVALGGLQVLPGIDREPAPVASLCAALLRLGRPDARLAVAVDNPASVLAMLREPQAEAADDDAAWFPPVDRLQPGTDVLARDLGGDGVAVLAGWPEAHHPTLLAGDDVEAGLVLAHAAPASAQTVADVRLATARALVAHARSSLAPVHVLTRPAGELLRVDRCDELVEETPAVGTLWLLDLLDACAARDLRRVRPLVSALQGAVAADPQGWALARSDDAISASDGTVALLHRHRTDAPGPADSDEVLVGLLDEAIGRLRASGWRHPWPAGVGHEEQTALVAAEVGLSPTEEAIAAARTARADRLTAAGVTLLPATIVASTPDQLARLQDENLALRGQVAWFKTQLRQRAHLIGQLRADAREEKRRLQRRIQQLQRREEPAAPSLRQRIRRRLSGR